MINGLKSQHQVTINNSLNELRYRATTLAEATTQWRFFSRVTCGQRLVIYGANFGQHGTLGSF